MKRIVKSPVAPKPLSDYIATHAVGTPEHDWDVFCDMVLKSDKVSVQRQIRQDQRGICAYCEIDLADADGSVRNGEPIKADFQVDHFHPKSDKDLSSRPVPDCDWSLYWPNLYGCCMGGGERLLADEGRFAARKSNHHCGTRKKDKVQDDQILDPVNIPAFPCLFKEKSDTGAELFELEPDVGACKSVSPDTAKKVENSIEILGLNCTLLSRRRREVVQKLLTEVRDECARLGDFDSALELVMEKVFDPTSDRWPSFFTAIRAHFGEAAESRLRAINYVG